MFIATFFFFIFNFLMLLIFERGTECEWGKSRERGNTEFEAGSRLELSAQSPMWDSNP